VRPAETAVTALAAIVFITGGAVVLRYPALFAYVKQALFWTLALITALLTLLVIARLIWLALGARPLGERVNALSLAALIYPLLLLLTANLGASLSYFAGFALPIVPALFLGVIFAHLSTWKPGRGEANRVMRVGYEGFRMAVWRCPQSCCCSASGCCCRRPCCRRSRRRWGRWCRAWCRARR